ncbi:uncharacterized protein LOC135694009 [Rhopilema esculentum]|uniref:uncharacterized protein LOC135694009 n=1 Tax=Rhopilema esculentum TaxID=499914 RepID=UPI0031CE9DB6
MSAQCHSNRSEQDEGREEYLETMKRLAVASLLPKSELAAFDGNPLKYFVFIRSFENNVEKDTNDFSRRLQLLIQYCTGKAKRVIESCILLEPEEGYWKAKNMLADRFGNVFKVSNAWIEQESGRPLIRPSDRGALQELADDLESCEITLKATGRLGQINNKDKLVQILERCPVFVRSRWQSCVQEILSKGPDPNVNVKKLIKAIAMEKNDAVFGALLDGGVKDSVSSTRMGTRQGHTTMRPAPQRNMNFSIQTSGENSNIVVENVKCYYCNKHHKLESCDEFRRLPGEDKFRFIREKKICDNSLSSFHFSAGCK